MTEQHRATPDMWAALEEMSAPEYDCTILELRARVEALEATQHVHAESTRPPHQDKLDRLIALDRDDPSPAGSLVERVGDVFLCKSFSTDDPLGARAVLHEVAAAARSRDLNGQGIAMMTWEMVARWLEQEATR
jgi:hypothetical protein